MGERVEGEKVHVESEGKRERKSVSASFRSVSRVAGTRRASRLLLPKQDDCGRGRQAACSGGRGSQRLAPTLNSTNRKMMERKGSETGERACVCKKRFSNSLLDPTSSTVSEPPPQQQ